MNAVLILYRACRVAAEEPDWVEHLPQRWRHDDDTAWLPDPPPPYLVIIRENWRDMVKRAGARAGE